MCGRFSQYSSVSDLVAHFDVDESLIEPAEVRPRYNLAPTQQALVVAASGDGASRRLGTMRWGLVPHWAKDVSIGNRMINARADKVTTSNAYRVAFARRRCLVPADGFYEWASPEHVPDGAKPAKTPFHIHTVDHTPLALAGLWEVWHDADDQALRTFTILTTDANQTMARVHHRMPVIVARSDWDIWLTGGALNESDRSRLLAAAPEDLLVMDQVSTRVNRPANDAPELIAPL